MFNYIKFLCDLNVIIRIECIFLVVSLACKSVDRGTFLARFIQNVLRSTHLHANKTTKKMHSILK
jgi:hypothetical protein